MLRMKVKRKKKMMNKKNIETASFSSLFHFHFHYFQGFQKK